MNRPRVASWLAYGLSVAIGLGATGCASSLRPDSARGGYAIEARGTQLGLIVLPGTRGRRFQGTIAPSRGGRLLGAIVARAELRERVALDGEVIQFDLEPSAGVTDEFNFAITNGCAKLDLLIDGRSGESGVRGRGVRLDRRGNSLMVCTKGR